MNALIGHTGFVGKNLLDKYNWDYKVNSKNIHEIKYKKFDLVVCAGVRAEKWWSNLHPEDDKKSINELICILQTIKADRFILISTIDVYQRPIGCNEVTTIRNKEITSAYGKNRHAFEIWCRKYFRDSCQILRLPALFGTGLKKNVLYDLLNKNQIEKINLNSYFQWYPISKLWSDIEAVIFEKNLITNLSTEPIKTKFIQEAFFKDLDIPVQKSEPSIYDVHSIYTKKFGSPYHLTKSEIIKELELFLDSYHEKQ